MQVLLVVLCEEVGICHEATRRPVSVLFVPFNFWKSVLIRSDHVQWIRNKLERSTKFQILALIHLRYLQYGTVPITKACNGPVSI
jgi:hypothetical protein